MNDKAFFFCEINCSLLIMKLSLALSLSAHLQLVYFIYSLSISVIWVCMLLKLLYLFAFTGAVSICSLARSLVELTWTFGAVRRYNVFSVKVMLHLCTWLYQFIFTLSNVISLGSSWVELRAACVCACCGLEAASSFSRLVFASQPTLASHSLFTFANVKTA